MNLMVVYAIACVAIGVLAGNLGRGRQLAILALATVVAGLYFVYPVRFL